MVRSKKCPASGIKLAPPVQHATVMTVERRENDPKLWYSIKVVPMQTDIRLVNGCPGKKPMARQPYTISRRYEDFAHFSQQLHEAFPTPNVRSAGPRIPKLAHKRLQLLPNQQKKHRVDELNGFLRDLFVLPPAIAQSLPVLEFFGLQREDRLRKSILLQDSTISTTSSIHPLAISPTTSSTLSTLSIQSTTSQYQPMSPPLTPSSPPLMPTPSPSTSTISSLCSHAQSMMRWRRTPHPSSSPPLPPMPVTSASMISSTSSSSHESQSTCATSVFLPSPSTSPTLRLIKIKVIYDRDNIIVIQVPRNATLADLRARILQKFCDLDLPKDFTLLFNDTRSSASSNTSAESSFSVDTSTATLITREADLARAQSSLWVRLDKVTLRCIA